jgi:FtsZ-interacting cell division protein ZipA
VFWLRPILLLAGALLIVLLFWWERRRPRQAAAADGSAARTERQEQPERAEPSFGAAAAMPLSEREQRRALPVIDWSNPSAPAPEPAPAAGVGSGLEEGVEGAATDRGPPVTDAAAAVPPMIIDWPEENARRIVTLRVVPAGGERLPGRALRQGLSACGFRHGQFGIFHLPGDDGRVILSAASLVRPGTLDPAAMDFQRYAGLNLFAVLPGPLETGPALERLGQVALDLAGRVSGRVHDEHGTPLGTAGVADWRRRMLGTPGGTGLADQAGPAS